MSFEGFRKKAPLTCQSVKVCLVIRKNKKIKLETIKQYCETYFKFYAFIEHDKDVDENGQLDGVHYHIVGDFKQSRVAFSTRLNEISQYFHFEDSNGVEIDNYTSFEGCLQYLTHKNQKHKYQYDKSAIITNIPSVDFEVFYNAVVSSDLVTFDLLYTICLRSSNIVEVIKDMGITNYRVWRNVVWDIWNTLNDKADFKKGII